MNAIVSLILILSSVGLFFGYINPTYTGATGSAVPNNKSIAELQSEAESFTSALTKSTEIKNKISELSTAFGKLDPAEVSKLEKFLPDNIDTVRLVIDINNRAAKYGMSISNITLSAPGVVSGATVSNSQSSTNPYQVTSSASGNVATGIGPDSSLYGSVKLGFNISGSYDNFLRFLRELEVGLRVVDITSLSFKAGKVQRSASGQVSTDPDVNSYSMAIRAYYLK